jgi:hypothetical protein
MQGNKGTGHTTRREVKYTQHFGREIPGDETIWGTLAQMDHAIMYRRVIGRVCTELIWLKTQFNAGLLRRR